MDAREFGMKMAAGLPGAGAAASVGAANASRPAGAPPPPQPVTVPGAAAMAPAGMPKLDIQPPSPPPAAGPAMPHQPGDPALAQPIPARQSIHDLPNNPEMERRWAGQQAKVDARARLAKARADFGRTPAKPPTAAPAGSDPLVAPAGPPPAAPVGLAGMGMGKGAAFGAAIAALKTAGATQVPVRKPISRTTKTGPATPNKWKPGHQYQGSKMQKVAAGDSILDSVLSHPATPYVAGPAAGAAGGLGLHELVMALHDRYAAKPQNPQDKYTGRMAALGAGAGVGLAGAATGKFASAGAAFAKQAEMDEGMAAGARAVKVRNVKPVTRNEWTGSHKDMTKRLAEACS